MPRSLQAKLLRVLQEREVTPVGGGAADPRRRAGRRRHPPQPRGRWSRDGRFREDLYYRLDVVPIELPPLRERREDIPALAEHFRREVNAREGRSVPGFALDVMQRLARYDWPGNVRELENLVERLVVLAGNAHGGHARTCRPTCAPTWSTWSAGRAAICRRAASICAMLLTAARGAPDRAGAGAHRRQQEPRRRAAGYEPHHTWWRSCDGGTSPDDSAI